MTHLGLFEGIGGFSLAASWMGWETLAWCEWNEFGQKILRQHFPKAEGFGDITKTDFKKYANRIDVLTGGFPCQPFSGAGQQLGEKHEQFLLQTYKIHGEPTDPHYMNRIMAGQYTIADLDYAEATPEQLDGNAKLISAAPTLLQAIVDAEKEITSMIKDFDFSFEVGRMATLRKNLKDVLKTFNHE
jgi:hypothetical protein